MRDPQPYVNLTIALIRRAMQDAYATHTTTNPDSTTPTPHDVDTAHAFLASASAALLTNLLELHPDIPNQILQARPPGQPRHDNSTYLPVADAAQRYGYHPEALRNLIRRGLIYARRSIGRTWLVDTNSLDNYRNATNATLSTPPSPKPPNKQAIRHGAGHH